MASPRGVFHQVHVVGFKTVDRAVTQPYLPYAGNADDELTPWRVVPVHELPGAQLAENNALRSHGRDQLRMVFQRPVLYVRFSIVAGIHPPDIYGDTPFLNQNTNVRDYTEDNRAMHPGIDAKRRQFAGSSET